MYILFIDSVIMGGSLQCIQKHFDDIWGKRPIHCWGKKPMEGLLPQLPFPSTSCTGVFYRLCLWFSVACREPTNAKLKGHATARMIYKELSKLYAIEC